MLDKCAGTAVDHIIRSGNMQVVYVGMSPVSNALLQAHASVKYQRYLRYVCGLDDRQFGKGGGVESFRMRMPHTAVSGSGI